MIGGHGTAAFMGKIKNKFLVNFCKFFAINNKKKLQCIFV